MPWSSSRFTSRLAVSVGDRLFELLLVFVVHGVLLQLLFKLLGFIMENAAISTC